MAGDERLRHEAEGLRRGSALLHRLIDVPRYKDRADLEALPDLERGINAVASTPEPHVHQRGIGLLLLGKGYGLVSTGCRANDLEPSGGECSLQLQHNENLVFDDQHSPKAVHILVRAARAGAARPYDPLDL